MPERWREVPPTAGLPLRWRDFLPRANVDSLDTTLAELLGVPTAQIECSGTAALIIALTTLKQMSGRRSVIIPAYTFPLVASPVIPSGLLPALFILHPATFNLYPATFELSL